MHVRIIRTGPSILRRIICEKRLSEARALGITVFFFFFFSVVFFLIHILFNNVLWETVGDDVHEGCSFEAQDWRFRFGVVEGIK